METHYQDLTCSSLDVLELIKGMRPRVASGPDGISARMIKGCAGSICEPLALLFGKSLSTGSVPLDWKSSAITPIFKAGDPALASNYWPISLLSLVSKLLERFIHNTLLEHVLEYGHLSPKQFGFRPGSSTQEAILAATHDWHEALERHNSVACVFFDLSKAFDSLPHSLVLASLAKVGVCGTLYSWFQSYLSGRQQRVVLNGVSSQPARVTSGVPQGSILGPLLFLLSINSIFDVSLSYNALINVYADDILLYKEIMSDLDLIAFQSDVSLIVEWVRTTNLHLNSSKTKSLLISRKRRPPDLRLHVDEVPVEHVPWFRYLGVTISEDLRWRRHIDEVCCRARRQLGFLYRCFGVGNMSSFTYMYKMLVLPVLCYCSSIWDPVQKGLCHQLERVQGFAARLATGSWSEDWATLCSGLGWCKLSTRRQGQKLSLCRRILKGGSIIPCDVFSPAVGRRVARHCMNGCQLKQPFVRTNYHAQSFFISTIPLWNSTLGKIVDLVSDLAFKRTLKSYLTIN